MAELDDKKTQAQEGAPEEVAPTEPQIQGLGDFLRREREKRGLSHEQIAELTRLRRHMVAALEEEAWDKLPQPVFVKGFIKSYANALGLDQKEVLDLYEQAPPPESETPKLVLEPRGASKKPLIFVLAAAVVIGAVLLFAWQDYWSEEKAVPAREKETQARTLEPAVAPTPGQLPEQKVVEEEVEPVHEARKPIPTVQETEEALPTEEPRVAAAEGGRGELYAEGPEELQGASGEEPRVDVVPGPAEASERHVLKAVVEDRTWIRITVDDEEPKEYIFQPGSRPQWNAKNGFDLVIGNAAGIEFEFDGQTMENLGELGQVVRLKLPEGYEGPARGD
jgi:cytoskeleton protein RodZ